MHAKQMKTRYAHLMSSSEMPPCPLPIDFEELYGKDPLGLLESLAACGDIIQFRMSDANLVFVNNAELVEKLMITQAKQFGHAKGLHRMAFDLGEGLLTSSGDHYLKHRRISQRAFRAQKIKDYQKEVIFLTQEFAEAWPKGQLSDLADGMMQLTLMILGQTLFNIDLKNHTRTIIDNMAELVDMVSESQHENVAISNARAALDAAIFEVLRDRAKDESAQADLYVDLNRHFESAGMLPEQRIQQMRDSILTMILAGHETTASVLAWVWTLLSQKPEVYRRMVEESQRVNLEEPIDLSQLPYVQAVLSETMRLYPPVWLTGRRALQDTHLGGYTIPRNTTVIFSQYILQRSDRYFEAPNDFRPERWLGELNYPKHAYLPFGAGHRKCIGADFAWMEASLILVSLLKRWDVNFVDGPLSLPSVGITMRPRSGIYATVGPSFEETECLWYQVDRLKPVTPKFLKNDAGYQSVKNFLKQLGPSFFSYPFAFEMDLSASFSQSRASLTLGVPFKGLSGGAEFQGLTSQIISAAGGSTQAVQLHLDALSLLSPTSSTQPQRLFFAVEKHAERDFDINGLVSTFQNPLNLDAPDETLIENLRWMLLDVDNYSEKDLSLWRRLCGSHSLEHFGVATSSEFSAVKLYPFGELKSLVNGLPTGVRQKFFKGFHSDISELCEMMGDHKTNLVLDIVDGSLRRVGIELKLRHKQEPRSDEEVALIFSNSLLKKSLSTNTIRELDYLIKPQSVNGVGALALNHLKVSFVPEGKLQWKAYFVYL